MRDEQHGRAVFFAQSFDQIDDPRLNRHVEGGCGFVQDQKRWFRHQRHRDHDALLLTA